VRRKRTQERERLVTDDQICQILSKMNIPLEWVWKNFESIRSLSFSSAEEMEFSELIGDWYFSDLEDGVA